MQLISDSGSTKTDWCITNDGRIVRRIITQGINPFHQSGQTIYDVLNGELLPELADVKVDEVYFYGSGCREECVPMMTDVLSCAFSHASTIEVHSDLLGAARAVCGMVEGIACILGTGANSCLYDGRDIVMNTPPLGYILGDEGSGAVLGRLFVNALYKNQLPESVLSDFERETGCGMADVIHRVYREPMANRFLASFAPFIHSHLYVPSVRLIVVDNFRMFFRRNVVQYGRPKLPVGAVGSIAGHFYDEFVEAAIDEGFTVGRTSSSPMSGLVEYHSCN